MNKHRYGSLPDSRQILKQDVCRVGRNIKKIREYVLLCLGPKQSIIN